MSIIHKKCWPQEFDALLSGSKQFDLRLHDFEIQVGDTLVLEEWGPLTKTYTGRTIEKKVTYLLPFKTDTLPYWSEDDIHTHGLVIMSLS